MFVFTTKDCVVLLVISLVYENCGLLMASNIEKPVVNLTVFLGQANNIFGPSFKIKTYPKIKFIDLKQNSSQTQSNIPHNEARSKRGVIHLYNMVSCATGCNPFIYKGYGCYCGFLGSGFAVDGIDRCCRNHDWCYDTARCPMFLEYFIPYYWKCWHQRPLCATQHGEFGGKDSCSHRLCECDRVLSECLRRYPCPSSRALCPSQPFRLIQNFFMNSP